MESERERMAFLGRDEDDNRPYSAEFWAEHDREAAYEAKRARVMKKLARRKAWIEAGGYYPRKCTSCGGSMSWEEACQVARKSGNDQKFDGICLDCFQEACKDRSGAALLR